MHRMSHVTAQSFTPWTLHDKKIIIIVPINTGLSVIPNGNTNDFNIFTNNVTKDTQMLSRTFSLQIHVNIFKKRTGY
jgi:hypothetical protein